MLIMEVIMSGNYKAINEMLLSLHNRITGSNDNISDIVDNFIDSPLKKPFVHDTRISGKVIRNGMVNPEDYYKIMG